jgi:N-acylneuraminate cytidylyltransferase
MPIPRLSSDIPEDILTIIPARGGSKGISKKNIRPLAGKPLLAYTIEHARGTPAVDRVIVSTDDVEIGAVAQEYGAEVIRRPAAISGDEASSESALLHALDQLQESEGVEPDLVVFLQATSPLRRPDDIERAIKQLRREEADSLLSVVRVYTWLWRMVDGRPVSFNYDYRNRPRRQERPAEYNENGSIYIFKPWVLRKFNNRLGGKIALYEMDARSNVDIETIEDLTLAEWILRHQHQGENVS